MLSKPVTFMLCELCANLIGINQLTALSSGITLFNLGAGLSQPFFVLVKQFQRPLDYFARIVKRPGAEHLVDQLLVFWSEGDCHVRPSWVSDYRGSAMTVKLRCTLSLELLKNPHTQRYVCSAGGSA
jgi:hypothetical protein